ncbi:MAG TPA: hypothetical protein VHO25_07590, partial [Polyangiaceae bacterium]|nr:hypothetical protein [Polyangiaceae bacterium]
YECSFIPADNVTLCTGFETEYVVYWAETEIGTVGQIVDNIDGTILAYVSQSETGTYIIEWEDGTFAECAVIGDVANLCLFTP